ncbi:MAG TPA: hypothetical protein VLE96_06680 [Chlamydiales bacterium]|nr:hypothetical protein [Chlamydiales bacterium]
METRHPWRARLIVGILMLFLAFLGMVITDIFKTGGWDYWKWVVGIYALLALWLSWYIRRNQEILSPITLGHELMHWIGVVATVFIVSYFVSIGIVSRYVAGIFDLTLLSLGVFLAGIYIESTFILVGIVLGLLALFSAFVTEYLYAVIIPILIGGAIVIAIMIWLSHQKTKQNIEKK